jgi:hypothetical protein
MSAGNLSPHIKRLFQQSLVNKCHKILIDGYNAMKSANIPLLHEMEEDNITANLIEYMNIVPETKHSSFLISPQYPLYNSAVLSGAQIAKASPVIDIRLFCWTASGSFDYYIEAKNLSKKNWKKSNLAVVNSTYYKKRYITTGIDHFVSGYYPKGCLIGYVVNGLCASIVPDINAILVSMARNSEVLGNKQTLFGHRECYDSTHNKGYNLKHFILQII